MRRRGVLVSFLISLGSLALGWLSAVRFTGPVDREYKVVARWRIPGGKGLIIVTESRPTSRKLRLLGEQLRGEFRHLDNAVVMVFDDPRAARRVRRGSRVTGEERFREAVLHQRAMYLKSDIRGEHSFTLYERYPTPREVIRYGQVSGGSQRDTSERRAG